MHTIRKILALLLVLCTTLSLVACVGEVEESLDNQKTDLGKNESGDDAEKPGFNQGGSLTSTPVTENAEDVPAEGQTARPVITSVINKDVDTVIICGTCEENAVISASGFGLASIATVNAKGEIFAISLELVNSDATIEITATVEGKTESNPFKQAIAKAQGESGLLSHPIVVSDRFVLFDENALKVLDNNSVSYSQENKLTTSIEGLNVGSGDTEIIYVLAPSRERVLQDSVPEGTEISKVTLLKQTAKAIYNVSKENVHVIDLSEAFAAADKYPLFYDSYSGWTDYAAFVAYTEIMNYIAEKFPDAAPHGMDRFDVEAVEAYLGDLAGYLGIDREQFSETVYDFVPKFDLDIGKEYAYNTQTPPVVELPEESEEVSEEVSAEESGEVSSDEVVEEKPEEPEESEEIEAPDEEFLETFSLISDIKLTIGEKDYRFYNTEFKDEFYTTDSDYNPVLCDSEFAFGTNRTDLYLPSALIYRSSNTAPIVPMLAERFRNSVFNASGLFSIQGTKAKEYAGTPGNTNVDYIIVIITEEDLAKLY